MMKTSFKTRLPGATYAISDTGPLISAFQCKSFDVLIRIFAGVLVSPTCQTELKEHGWEEEIQSSSPHVVVVSLTVDEEKQSLSFAEQIAQHPETHNPVAKDHLGEAESIVLALRPEHHNDLLLLDEFAARSVAKQAKIKLSGFPGVLLLAVQVGLISAESLKTRLEECRAQGTHYGTMFIQQIYDMAKQRQR
jgi:predicted nucleic acid-binding protein